MKKEAKKNMQNTFELTKGTLPSLKKEQYVWEKNKKLKFEPWYLTTIALIVDVCLLFMYFFVNAFVAFQLSIGYYTILFSVLCIIASYILLKKKHWPLGTQRFTKFINAVCICITLSILGITILIHSIT